MRPRINSGWRTGLVALVLVLGCATPWFTSAQASAPHDGAVPWWRTTFFHTVQEEFFLRWMDSVYGPDWLRWMSDSTIEAHWRRFLLRWMLP